jgi:hypothetical protein
MRRLGLLLFVLVALACGALALATLSTSLRGQVGAAFHPAQLAVPSAGASPALALAATSAPLSPLPVVASPPSFEFTPPTFAGHVVHTVEAYRNDPGPGGAPEGVQDTVTDIWLSIDAAGHVQQVHTTTRDRSGAVVGEQLLTPRGGARLDAVGNVPRLSASQPCQSGIEFANASALDAMLPRFYDAALYAAVQGAPSGPQRPPSYQVPTLATVPGVTPLVTYPADTAVTTWVTHGRTVAGVTETSTVELGADGHVALIEGRDVDAAGQTTHDLALNYGAVEVYDAATLPATTFALTSGLCGS